MSECRYCTLSTPNNLLEAANITITVVMLNTREFGFDKEEKGTNLISGDSSTTSIKLPEIQSSYWKDGGRSRSQKMELLEPQDQDCPRKLVASSIPQSVLPSPSTVQSRQQCQDGFKDSRSRRRRKPMLSQELNRMFELRASLPAMFSTASPTDSRDCPDTSPTHHIASTPGGNADAFQRQKYE